VVFENGLINKILFLLSVVFFIFGVSLPMFSMEQFIFFKDTFSLVGGLFNLAENGEIFLLFIVFSFSIATPIYKFIICFRIVFQKFTCNLLKLKMINRLVSICKWSMADVFIIAILVSTVKIGGLAHVHSHIGLFVFGISVVFTMILTERILLNYELRPRSGELK